MKMPFGKYKGMEMTTLPVNYLQWLVSNFEPGDIRDEAARILKSDDINDEEKAKSLEEQANEILGEKPVKGLRRGFKRPGHRRK